jgi:hypothetical protein
MQLHEDSRSLLHSFLVKESVPSRRHGYKRQDSLRKLSKELDYFFRDEDVIVLGLYLDYQLIGISVIELDNNSSKMHDIAIMNKFYITKSHRFKKVVIFFAHIIFNKIFDGMMINLSECHNNKIKKLAEDYSDTRGYVALNSNTLKRLDSIYNRISQDK